MIRNAYMFKQQHEISTQNEPLLQIDISNIDVRQYPDMATAYQNAKSLLSIPDGYGFILGNGCENILKSTLLALSPMSLSYSVPSWGMVNVIADQLRIQSVQTSFMFDADKNALVERNNVKADVNYMTFKCNNFYKTECHTNGKSYDIIDCSYVNPCDIASYYRHVLSMKSIAIGGFQKTFGCGVRLGYAIFPIELDNEMQLQRENYINAVACYVLSMPSTKLKQLSIYNATYQTHLIETCRKLSVPYYICDQYLTVMTDLVPDIQHKHFTVNGRSFVRMGVEQTDEARHKVLGFLSTLCC